VSVRLSKDYDLSADLSGVSEVTAVEKVEDEELTYTILANDGASIFSQVSEIAQNNHWPVTEFHVERGQLEDVFRTVTQVGAGA